MNKLRGLALTELMIVVAFIGVLLLVAVAFLNPHKAEAHSAMPTGISAAMAEVGAQYTWANDTHSLIIIDQGSADWTTAVDVCKALEDKVEHAHVTLRSNTGTGELKWEDSDETRKLTNLPTSSHASC